jgi:hypothetical protein
MKRLTPTEFLDMMEEYGLEINPNSGGKFKTEYHDAKVKKLRDGVFDLQSPDCEPILFLGSQTLLKSIEISAQRMKITLFEK